jgi:tRNA G10  N-methylase Trm11
MPEQHHTCRHTEIKNERPHKRKIMAAFTALLAELSLFQGNIATITFKNGVYDNIK